MYKKYPISQHLQVTVYPLEATVFTVQTAQLAIADVQVKHYSKDVTATTHVATGAEVIIEANVLLGQLAYPLRH